jgi:hypothetical protein
LKEREKGSFLFVLDIKEEEDLTATLRGFGGFLEASVRVA